MSCIINENTRPLEISPIMKKKKNIIILYMRKQHVRHAFNVYDYTHNIIEPRMCGWRFSMKNYVFYLAPRSCISFERDKRVRGRIITMN